MNAYRELPGRSEVLVGRETLLEEIVERIADGRNVLLVGVAGVGKSRLIAELVLALPDRATEMMLASPGISRHRLGLFAALGGLSGVGPADPAILFDRYLRRWRTKAGRRDRVLLCVDDITHADDLSVALLRQAVAAGIGQVIATARTSEAVPESVLAVAVNDDLDVIEVPPLSDRDAVELVRRAARGPLGDGEIGPIVSRARGIPLFLREMARERGPLRSKTVEAVIQSRIMALTESHRRLTELIAVAEPADWRLFEAEQYELSGLLRSGLVVWADAEHVRLEHPLYAEHVLDHLGPLVTELYASLVSRSEHLDIDEVLVAEWTLSADGSPGIALAQTAARRAIERADASMAHRLAPYAGELRDLIRAQAMLIEGRVDDGMHLLDSVRNSDLPPLVRAEAASISARHLGLTRGDMANAHRVLDDAKGQDLPREAQRLLLPARLWLWIFGGLTPQAGPGLIAELSPEPGEPAWLSLEIILSGYAVMSQISGTTDLDGARRLRAAEQLVRPDGLLWARTRAVEAALIAHGGDAVGCVRMLEESLDDDRTASPSALRLIAGNISFYASTAGRLPLAARADARAYSVRAAEDTFRFGEQARLFHEGTFVLTGEAPDPCEWMTDAPSADALLSLELFAAARARCLTRPGNDVSEIVDAMINARSLGWLTLLYADCIDARNRGVHERIAAAYEMAEGTGLWSLVAAAARARAEDDPGGLLAAAEKYARAGFLAGATRACADVLRRATLSEPMRLDARRTLTYALQRWEGRWPAWVEGLSLPTPRQIEVVSSIINGQSVADIAATWQVSRRTIENHLFRASKSLGVAGIDGLRELFATLSDEVAAE